MLGVAVEGGIFTRHSVLVTTLLVIFYSFSTIYSLLLIHNLLVVSLLVVNLLVVYSLSLSNE